MCCSSSIGPCKFSKWPCNLFRERMTEAFGFISCGLVEVYQELVWHSHKSLMLHSSVLVYLLHPSVKINEPSRHMHMKTCQLYPTLNRFYCLQHMKHVAGRFTGTFRNWRVTALSDSLNIESKRELKHTKYVWWWFLSLWSQLCSVFG